MTALIILIVAVAAVAALITGVGRYADDAMNRIVHNDMKRLNSKNAPIGRRKNKN